MSFVGPGATSGGWLSMDQSPAAVASGTSVAEVVTGMPKRILGRVGIRGRWTKIAEDRDRLEEADLVRLAEHLPRLVAHAVEPAAAGRLAADNLPGEQLMEHDAVLAA